jgi:predicted RNA polymerase sigma factor
MLVELPSGKEDFGIGEPVGEEDFGSFNDLVGGDEPLVHVGMQRGREALAATVAVFQIALLVESSVSSQDPPEADKSDGRLLRRLDRVDEARLAYERALELVSSDAERRFLERRLAGLQPR